MNTRRADHRADIYSLGCTLYFLLTGQPLFGGETVMERIVAHREHPVPSLRKACPAAPPWLDGIFRKMVAKKPEDRYQSVTALVSDLAAARCAAELAVAWLVVMAAVLLAGRDMGVAGDRGGEPCPAPAGDARRTAATPSGTLPEQHEEKPLDLPVKPTWRTTGEYPLIAGVWSVVENKGTLVTDRPARRRFRRHRILQVGRGDGELACRGDDQPAAVTSR